MRTVRLNLFLGLFAAIICGSVTSSLAQTPPSKASTDINPILSQAERLYQTGDPAKRDKTLQLLRSIQVSGLTPDGKRRTFLLEARLLGDQAKHDQSLLLFEKANGISRDADSVHRMGVEYYETGEFAKCVSSMKDALKLDPGSAKSYWTLGKALGHLGLMDDAEKALSKAVALEPTSWDYIKERAALNVTMGKMHQAKSDMARLQQLDPTQHITMDAIQGASLKYSGDMSSFVQSFSLSNEELTLREISEIDKQLRNCKDPNQTQSLLLEKASREITVDKYQLALNDVNKADNFGTGSYRAHAIKAAAMFALHDFEGAKRERKVTVDLYAAQRNSIPLSKTYFLPESRPAAAIPAKSK